MIEVPRRGRPLTTGRPTAGWAEVSGGRRRPIRRAKRKRLGAPLGASLSPHLEAVCDVVCKVHVGGNSGIILKHDRKHVGDAGAARRLCPALQCGSCRCSRNSSPAIHSGGSWSSRTRRTEQGQKLALFDLQIERRNRSTAAEELRYAVHRDGLGATWHIPSPFCRM